MNIQEIIEEYMRGCSCGGPGECAECADAAIRAIAINLKKQECIMTDWIKWNGGECPIKSDKTRVEYKTINGFKGSSFGAFNRWTNDDSGGDIIAYRITEDHEPKMTREQITAQIETLQKQLDALPVVERYYWQNGVIHSFETYGVTHKFQIETINGVPHIHGVAMKEVTK